MLGKLENMVKTSSFQKEIETVEKLSLEEQEMLISTIQKRLSQQRRTILTQEVAQVREEVKEGNVKFGTVEEFLRELDQE